jgi:hypothetical protein
MLALKAGCFLHYFIHVLLLKAVAAAKNSALAGKFSCSNGSGSAT